MTGVVQVPRTMRLKRYDQVVHSKVQLVRWGRPLIVPHWCGAYAARCDACTATDASGLRRMRTPTPHLVWLNWTPDPEVR